MYDYKKLSAGLASEFYYRQESLLRWQRQPKVLFCPHEKILFLNYKSKEKAARSGDQFNFLTVFGGTEATSFELTIADLAEWFIANPTNTWRQELRVAANTVSEQSYRY